MSVMLLDRVDDVNGLVDGRRAAVFLRRRLARQYRLEIIWPEIGIVRLANPAAVKRRTAEAFETGQLFNVEQGVGILTFEGAFVFRGEWRVCPAAHVHRIINHENAIQLVAVEIFVGDVDDIGILDGALDPIPKSSNISINSRIARQRTADAKRHNAKQLGIVSQG